ncbi:MAG: MBL fold metallo-hydrolase [Verrucomicrobiales bacterium]|nr:MBL fold metallo-hydrolase [Verrucomicrobiales bacterium]
MIPNPQIRPWLKDDAFLADVEKARAEQNSTGHAAPRLDLWWLGQSGFLVHFQGRTALLDPYLSDSLTRKYAGTDKPHVRMSERVIAPERLDFIDVVTSSHTHTDHLDPETLRPLVAANPGLHLVCPEANRATVQERSGLDPQRILGMDAASPDGLPAHAPSDLSISGFRFIAVPAAHEELSRDASNRLIYLGWVLEAGPFRLYHSGDTIRFPAMADALRPYQIDLALLPINGRAPERRVAGNLWGREAAELAKDIGARQAIPCHYDMFTFNTASPDEFRAACDTLHQGYRVLGQGERLTLTGRTDSRV